MQAVRTKKASIIPKEKTAAFEEAFAVFTEAAESKYSTLTSQYLPKFAGRQGQIKQNANALINRMKYSKDSVKVDALTKDVYKQASILGIKQE